MSTETAVPTGNGTHSTITIFSAWRRTLTSFVSVCSLHRNFWCFLAYSVQITINTMYNFFFRSQNDVHFILNSVLSLSVPNEDFTDIIQFSDVLRNAREGSGDSYSCRECSYQAYQRTHTEDIFIKKSKASALSKSTSSFYLQPNRLLVLYCVYLRQSILRIVQ